MAKKINSENPVIQSYIRRRVKGTSRNQGKRLFNMGGCQLLNFEATEKKAVYNVESEFYYDADYQVSIHNFDDYEAIKAECSCPYDWGNMCKHEVAALLALEKRLGVLEPTVAPIKKDGKLKMDAIDEWVMMEKLSPTDWSTAQQIAKSIDFDIETNNNRTATATIDYKEDTFKVSAHKRAYNEITTTCTCEQHIDDLCIHRAVLLIQLSEKMGENAFELMQDWDEYKEKLLAPYGFGLADNLENKFDFKMGKKFPELIILDKSILKVGELKKWGKKYKSIAPKDRVLVIPAAAQKQVQTKKKEKAVAKYGLAYAFDFWKRNHLPGFELIPIVGKLNAEETELTAQISPLINANGAGDLQKVPVIDANDVQLIELSKELSWRNIGEFARTVAKAKVNYTWNNGGGYFVNSESNNSKANAVLNPYLLEKTKLFFSLLQDKIVYGIKDINKNFSTRNLFSLNIDLEKAKLHFDLKKEDEFVELTAYIKIKGKQLRLREAKMINKYILLSDETLYLLDSNGDTEMLELFVKTPHIKVRQTAFPTLLTNVILPLKSKYSFNDEINIALEEKIVSPVFQVYLKESEEFMMIQPIVIYGEKQQELDEGTELIFEEENKLISVKRDKDAEQKFAEFIQSLHPGFPEQVLDTDGIFYYLMYDDVMYNAWFLGFYEQLQEKQIEVFGFKELSNFQYSMHKPTIDFKVSSGIDWFDIKAEIQFGEESISLKEVQKALVRKEKFVRLSDGKKGLLPEQWIKKYATLFKMGNIKSGNLRVSKVHFSLVDELYDQINEDDILLELRQKKEKLKSFDEIKQVILPESVNADLRPYQKEGFNWFNFLDEFGWGGCLADDMGLGKTLQVLTFLSALKKKHGQTVNLVVVPTSLIFNWEAEVNKFCTDLTIHRHHGTGRIRHKIDEFEKYDIVITSYGTLASDIEIFNKFVFNYVILDESQSIKNPSTKRYKAVCLLNAKNRLALTGTPIENNIYDLYAQFNFLNPGMLGSREFFKEEFANPIDKFSDPNKVNELKKIIFPFLLRRTKELVAHELPPKTEIVLFCEMEARQRKVYDAFRESYRHKILERIEEDGINRAGVYILEGLMKLRQICDSPAILKDPEDYGNESVKLKELVKNITEKTGNHKILIFSQFLGMLKLVREALEHHQIDYEYLDGSMTPKARQSAVNRFQESESCRVFLISLKAGGFGLNLTAADYVYIVDPWWNPAVEQQAVDRSHRIGQTKKVFAYKMICKGTVEEKILKLQTKKRALAKDIISTEKSFIKNLTATDIEFLFS